MRHPDLPGSRRPDPSFTVRPGKPLYAGRPVKYALIEPTKRCPYRRPLLLPGLRAGRFCLAGRGPHGELSCIDADRTVYGCLTHREPDLRMGTVAEDGELHIGNAPFVAGYHRRRCCVMDYHWGRLLTAGEGPTPALLPPAAGP